MLHTLKITNFAIIKEAKIDFEEGLNILSGETGAGKSMVVDAISLLLGARPKTDDIRTGEEEATIEGVFSIDGKKTGKMLEDSGIQGEVGELIVRRVISKSGRNRIFINDVPGTQAFLYELGKEMVDICAHNENRFLMDQSYHIDLLDSYALTQAGAADFSESYAKLKGLLKTKDELVRKKNETQEKAEFLKFLIKEIDELKLKEGEEEELKAARKRLANMEKIKELASGVHESVYSGEGAILERFKKLSRDLDLLRSLDPALKVPSEPVSTASERLKDLAFEIKAYMDSLDFDAARLEEVEDRLERVMAISRKYGSLRQAIDRRDTAMEELKLLDDSEGTISQIEKQQRQIGGELRRSAQELSSKRKKRAIELSGEINGELASMSMEKASFSVRMDDLTGDMQLKDSIDLEGKVVNPKGSDHVAFYITTNVGEEPRPLEHVASLGELSRIMLAVKGVFYSKGDSPGSFVFDEIDAGIGGRVAEMVGKRLKRLSAGKQVICVTHLSQIASYADRHLLITKSVSRGRTLFDIRKLEGDSRKEEIARMLGGVTLTEKTRALAEELLERTRSDVEIQ